RGPVEASPAGVPARRSDADVPGLAAGDEPDDVEEGGGGEDPQRCELHRRGEIAPLPGEAEDERAADDEGAGERHPRRMTPERGAQPRQPSLGGARGSVDAVADGKGLARIAHLLVRSPSGEW